MEIANQISLLNNDTLLHVIDSIDDTHAIVAFCLSSKRFFERVVSLIQPKLQYSLPLSIDKYTSLSKKVNVYRSLISARNTAPGLQFFEFSCPRSSSGVKLEAFKVVTKVLPWNSNYFLEISHAQSIVQKGPAYLCLYSMDQAAPMFTADLLNGNNPSESILVFETLAFNSKLKYFALAYRYSCKSPIQQVVRVYAIRDEGSVELILNEEHERQFESPIHFPEMSMVITDQGDLWVAHFINGPVRISLGDKKITKLDVSPITMRKGIKFLEYKGKVLLLETEESDVLSVRINDIEHNTMTQSYSFDASMRFEGIKGDLLVFSEAVFGEHARKDCIAIDLEKRTTSNYGNTTLSSSGHFLLDQTKLDQISVTNLTNSDLPEKSSIKLSDNMAYSASTFQWSNNSDTIVTSVPYKRCVVIDGSLGSLHFMGTIESSFTLPSGDYLVKFQHKFSAVRATSELSKSRPEPAQPSLFGGFPGFSANRAKLKENITENKKPAIGIMHLEQANKNGTVVMPSFELPFESDLAVIDCVVSNDQKHFIIVGTCEWRTIVLKMKL